MMLNKNNIKYILGLTLFFYAIGISLHAREYPSVAVFGLNQKGPLEFILNGTVENANKYFKELGRFYPVSKIQINKAKRKAQQVKTSSEYYRSLAEQLKVDLYLTVNLYKFKGSFYCEAKIVPLNKNYLFLQKDFQLKSKIAFNLPLLLSRKIVMMHKDIPIVAKVDKIVGESFFTINAGEWSGIESGTKYRLESNKQIKVLQNNRFSAYIIGSDLQNSIVIKKYPDTNAALNEINQRIEKNIIQKYGIEYRNLKGVESEKNLFEGICVINPLGNVCLPVYGSYLSASYLGFENPVPDYYGMSIAGVSFLAQLLTVPAMNEFKGNFLPWKQDNDKNNQQYRLHKFLWGTIPFTLTASFLNQLTHQYFSNQVLPPLFENRNIMSMSLSVVCPGGGLFYKGYQRLGWAYFLSELSLAGYASYHLGSKNGKYALIGLGALKFIEIINAILIKPGYSFYNDEFDIQDSTSFLLGITEDQKENDLKLIAGIQKLF